MRMSSKKTQWALLNGRAKRDLDLREAFRTARLSCRSRLTWTALSAPCHRSTWCLEASRKPRSSYLYRVACQNTSLQDQNHERRSFPESRFSLQTSTPSISNPTVLVHHRIASSKVSVRPAPQSHACELRHQKSERVLLHFVKETPTGIEFGRGTTRSSFTEESHKMRDESEQNQNHTFYINLRRRLV